MGTSTYTEQVGTTICDRIAEGESLRKICADTGMPSKTTVFRWLEDNEAFRDQYARAREWQAESLLDEAIEIADEVSENDSIDTKFGPMPNKEWLLRSKLRVETRLKLMGQLAPKKYGPKMSITTKDENPVQQLTDQELLDELRKHLPAE